MVSDLARGIETPAVAKEVIRRLDLRMTPDELLDKLAVVPRGRGIRIFYRSPVGGTPEEARSVVRTVAEVAAEYVRVDTPYAYDWGLG